MGVERELAFERARQKWAGVALDFERWCAHLDQLGWTGEPPRTADAIFLCCACLHGDRAACARLEAEYFPSLRAVAAKVDRDPDFVDEVLQLTRQRLLVGTAPTIGKYDGRGQLRAWLRVIVRNLAIDQKRPKKNHAQLTAALEEVWDAKGGDVLADSKLRRDYASIFARCAKDALAALPLRDRTLLRMSLVHGCSVDALGQMYNRDRSVAHRWLVKSKERLRDDFERRVRQAFGQVEDAEYQSLARLVRSQLDLSVSLLFDADPS